MVYADSCQPDVTGSPRDTYGAGRILRKNDEFGKRPITSSSFFLGPMLPRSSTPYRLFTVF